MSEQLGDKQFPMPKPVAAREVEFWVGQATKAKAEIFREKTNIVFLIFNNIVD